MPSVGSTPTSSPAVTSAFSQPANCQQISFHSFLQHRHSSVSNILSDTTQTASTTTSSTSSTPIHSPPSQTSLDSIQSNQPYITTSGGIINPLSLNCQQQQLPNSQVVVATISNGSSNNINRNQTTSVHHHNNQKYSKFMIITPAVSIDRNFDSETGAPANDECNDEQSNFLHYCYNLNSINNNPADAANINYLTKNTLPINNENYLRSNYNSTTINDNNQRNHRLLSKTANGFYRSSSWRWCTFICAAMRCFGGGRNTNAPYTTTFSRKYTPLHSEDSERRRRRSSSSSSSGTKINFTTNRLLRNHKKNLKNFEQQFNHHQQSYTTPRKTRDHLNNITYEL